MTWLDYTILGVILFLALLAVVYLLRRRKAGKGCGGYSCGAGCTGCSFCPNGESCPGRKGSSNGANGEGSPHRESRVSSENLPSSGGGDGDLPNRKSGDGDLPNRKSGGEENRPCGKSPSNGGDRPSRAADPGAFRTAEAEGEKDGEKEKNKDSAHSS